jgi:hypothetical protein
MLVIVLLILGVSGACRNDYDQDQEHEQEWGPGFTPDRPMLRYRFDDAEPAVSIA